MFGHILGLTLPLSCDAAVALAGRETPMSQGRVLQLTRKHQDLEEKIRQATLSPSTDDLAVRAMKREKLRLKEMIAAAN